ncbi:hypothetical protein C8J57DRAFT_1509881 [Mycena rebaudengoi]|nr:hypothetical protein C8J57DRAFT_1509881 [Mycena rebaudengoi]
MRRFTLAWWSSRDVLDDTTESEGPSTLRRRAALQQLSAHPTSKTAYAGQLDKTSKLLGAYLCAIPCRGSPLVALQLPAVTQPLALLGHLSYFSLPQYSNPFTPRRAPCSGLVATTPLLLAHNPALVSILRLLFSNSFFAVLKLILPLLAGRWGLACGNCW